MLSGLVSYVVFSWDHGFVHLQMIHSYRPLPWIGIIHIVSHFGVPQLDWASINHHLIRMYDMSTVLCSFWFVTSTHAHVLQTTSGQRMSHCFVLSVLFCGTLLHLPPQPARSKASLSTCDFRIHASNNPPRTYIPELYYNTGRKRERKQATLKKKKNKRIYLVVLSYCLYLFRVFQQEGWTSLYLVTVQLLHTRLEFFDPTYPSHLKHSRKKERGTTLLYEARVPSPVFNCTKIYHNRTMTNSSAELNPLHTQNPPYYSLGNTAQFKGKLPYAPPLSR